MLRLTCSCRKVVLGTDVRCDLSTRLELRSHPVPEQPNRRLTSPCKCSGEVHAGGHTDTLTLVLGCNCSLFRVTKQGHLAAGSVAIHTCHLKQLEFFYSCTFFSIGAVKTSLFQVKHVLFWEGSDRKGMKRDFWVKIGPFWWKGLIMHHWLETTAVYFVGSWPEIVASKLLCLVRS